MSFKPLAGWELDRLGKLGGARSREFMESDANYIKVIERAISSRTNLEKIMEYKKDYGLLRPVDLEAAKCGEKICDEKAEQFFTYAAGPSSEKEYIFNDLLGRFVIATTPEGNGWRMAPLAWVEGRPVYKGDVLYVTVDNPNCATVKAGSKFYVVSKGNDEGNLYNSEWYINKRYLTWQKPKTKREGWVNLSTRYTCSNPYYTKEEADFGVDESMRIACIRIEWEE